MSARAQLTQPLFVALDVDTAERALELVKQTRAFVGGFKVGPRLGVRYGGDLLKEIARHGMMFVDNKYLDIPSTMEAAVRASFDVGASFCTVHAQAGREALTLMAEVEHELSRTRPFRILVVTVLTSFRQDNMPPNWKADAIEAQTLQLAEMAIGCGLNGLVCSPQEVKSLRTKFPESYLVTPGVRLSQDERGDQARVTDPATALRNGASALVVGRPICQALEPAQAAKTYYEEIQKA